MVLALSQLAPTLAPAAARHPAPLTQCSFLAPPVSSVSSQPSLASFKRAYPQQWFLSACGWRLLRGLLAPWALEQFGTHCID